MQNAAAFVLHLHLFLGIVVAVGGVNKRDHIQRDLCGKGLDHRLLSLGQRGHLLFQFPEARLSGAGHRLIGAGDHALDRGELVDAGHGHQRDDGAAVRVCDDPLVLQGVLAVDFRNNQRHVRIQPEGRAVVDIHRSALFDRRGKALAHGSFDRAEYKIQALEAIVGRLLNHDLAAVEEDLFARAAGAGQQAQLLDGDLILLQDLQHFLSDGARCTENSYLALFHDMFSSLFIRRSCRTGPGSPFRTVRSPRRP